MDNSVELIGTTEYLTLQARCRINRYRYNRVLLRFSPEFHQVETTEWYRCSFSKYL
jgi:hypothetical protein